MDNLIHQITIGEWSYFTKSDDHSKFKKYKINKNNISELIGIVKLCIDGKENTNNWERDKLNSKFKIQELIVLFKSINTLMVHREKIEKWLAELGLEVTDLNKDLNKNIKEKCDKLKLDYGITVEELIDLKKIEREIDRRLDKFDERFKKVVVKKGGVSFPKLIIDVFRILKETINYNMVLSDFSILMKKTENNGTA